MKSFFCDSVWFLPMEKLSIITRSCNTSSPVLVSALSETEITSHLDGTSSSGPHQTVLKILDNEALLTNSKFSEGLKIPHITNIAVQTSNFIPLNCLSTAMVLI